MAKNETAASGVGARHGGNIQKMSTTALNHTMPISASLFIPIYDGGKFIGLMRFADSVAARAALRQGFA